MPLEVVFEKMTNGKGVEITGFKVDRSNALDILDKPEGFETLSINCRSIQK